MDTAAPNTSLPGQPNQTLPRTITASSQTIQAQQSVTQTEHIKLAHKHLETAWPCCTCQNAT
jgi:hypothetical protein